jgi:hypothetical protein
MAAGKPDKRKPVRRPASARTAGKTRRRAPVKPIGWDPKDDFTEEEWHDMVATAAYHRAESRGFEEGSAEEDWFEAEAQLREQLARAEDEADTKDEASFDLTAHRSIDQRED